MEVVGTLNTEPVQKWDETSDQLFERSKKVSPGGVHSPVRAFKGVGGTPVFIKEAKGSILTDVAGKSYVDFCMSWGPLFFGHQDPDVKEAVKEALDRGWSFGAAEPYSLKLAELITGNLPWIEKVRFVSSGTEAVMSALRVARAATGRELILKFEGCYHGHADSMLVKAGSGLAEMSSPDSAGVSAAVARGTLCLPLGDLNKVQEAFQKFPSEIAAIIVEPIPANNGLLLQTDDFLKGLRELSLKYGALLLFDEVITGFRVGFKGMAGLTGIRPDLVTFGKVIGGGFPVGAYGGRKDLMDLVAPIGPVYQAGTLSGNPVAMVAGTAMLQKLLIQNPYADLQIKTDKFSRAIEQVGQRRGIDIRVKNFASLFWIVFGGDAPSADHKAIFSKVFHGLLNRGFYLPPSAFEVGFLSTAHKEQELDQFLLALEHVL